MSTNQYMTQAVVNYLAEKLVWEQGKDPERPYFTNIAGGEAVIRVNDFPDENLYTLIINDVEVLHFNDWPEQWDRP